METIPEALTTNTVGPISIADLAKLIEAPVEKLRGLVEHEYLRVVMAKEEFEQTIVARPRQSGIDWLKMMFQPVKMRPLIPLREVGKLWKVTENHVLKVCRSYRIPVYHDPELGHLMSFNALKSFATARGKYFKPKGYSRAPLLRYFLSQIVGVAWKNPPSYSRKLQLEINRVAHLPEPERTIRSCELIEVFRDAKTAAECIRQGQEIPEEWLEIEATVEDLQRKVLTQEWGIRENENR